MCGVGALSVSLRVAIRPPAWAAAVAAAATCGFCTCAGGPELSIVLPRLFPHPRTPQCPIVGRGCCARDGGGGTAEGKAAEHVKDQIFCVEYDLSIALASCNNIPLVREVKQREREWNGNSNGTYIYN